MTEAFAAGRGHVNGVDFAWLEHGDGPVVLALHGFPDVPRTFRHQMTALTEAGYRVVAPYMRGYFPTEAPENASYAGAALATDAVGLIERLSDEPVVLMGHDWGATAAYGAAVLAPERISRLITFAVPRGDAFWSSWVNNPLQQRRSWYIYFFHMPFAEAAVALDDFAFVERLWQQWSPGWEYPRDVLGEVKETLGKPGVLQAALNYYRHSFGRAGPEPDPRVQERLGEPIEVPALYFHGARDGGIGVETVEGMEGWFRAGLEKRIIEAAGHFVHQERPDQVNRDILAFLSH